MLLKPASAPILLVLRSYIHSILGIDLALEHWKEDSDLPLYMREYYEPPRVYRRLFYMSPAANGTTSNLV